MSWGPHSATTTERDALMDALTDQLVAADLLELFTDDDDDEAMRLTPEGECVARQLAMADEDGADALLAALLQEPKA